jgi:hypothetical protein
VLRTGARIPLVGRLPVVGRPAVGAVDKRPPTVLRTGSIIPVDGNPMGRVVGDDVVETVAVTPDGSGRVVAPEVTEPRVEPTVPSKLLVDDPSKLEAVEVTPPKRFVPVEVTEPAVPKRFEPVDNNEPAVPKKCIWINRCGSIKNC